MNILDYFFDPVLRGPTLGSIFLGLSASLIGVILFLNKKSLLSETLSHASYPGVVIAMIVLGQFSIHSEVAGFFITLIGAFTTSCIAVYCVRILNEKFKVSNDAALCFILSSFFGIGLLLASRIQISMSFWYRKVQTFLFGQAATMRDIHIWIYLIVSVCVICFIVLFYRKLQVFLFDKNYAKSLGIKTAYLEKIILFFLVLTIVVGIRSVGVVLVSALLIIPSVFAVPLTKKLFSFFIVAAVAGIFFALCGNIISVEFSKMDKGVSFPTGPVIILFGSICAFSSFLFAPQKGILAKWVRIASFKKKCLQENILKSVVKLDGNQAEISYLQNLFMQNKKRILLKNLRKMEKAGWVEKNEKKVFLTIDGEKKALYIIRLHRLWELYLNNQVGIAKEKVHQSAELMEHILTPDLEKKLDQLLADPKKDPHKQPIPEKF